MGNNSNHNRFILNIVTQMEAAGAQKAALQVCEELIERGYRSEVWFLYKKRATFEALTYVKCVSDERPRNLREFVLLLIRLREWMSDTKPMGVITYTHYANIIGQVIAYTLGVENRLATHHSPSWSYPLVARLCDMILGTLGVYTSIIYVSESVRKSFVRYPCLYKSKGRVVVNGLRVLRSRATKAEARQGFGLPQDAIIVVNIGRLAYEKNQQMLIKAIARIPDDEVLLAIAGDGELRTELQELVRANGLERRVFLLGELEPTRIPELLVAGDIFAFPSRYEAFGFALVEAMMLGLPVLVSDIEAHRDVVGNAGIFLPVHNSQAWRDAILRLSKDSKFREEFGARAKERATLYTLNRMVDGYIRVLFG